MKNKYRILTFFPTIALIIALIPSCASDDDFPEEQKKDTKLNLFVNSRAADALVMGGDGSFTSLALYVYNKDDGYCEYAELVPELDQGTEELFRSVNISSKTKVIYAIANYNDPQKNFSVSLSEATTMPELEALIAANTDFTDTKILMVGEKEIIIDSESVTAEVPMQRLAARLDVYVFKSRDVADSEVLLKSVEFGNQILNTDVKYKSPRMAQPVDKRNIIENITENEQLNGVPPTEEDVKPEDLHASFYSYQNISISGRPDKDINPYLRITVSINGTEHTYIGYIESFTQTEGRFSLVRNRVYRVVAILGGTDTSIILDTSVLPWTLINSEIGHNVTDADFQFDAWGNDSEALKGVVQYPYIDSGGTQNKTSFANYSFRMTGPPGALWTATLTNGLDFYFGKGGTTNGKNAVSQGISRDEPYEIKVGASKSWAGKEHATYMYITVNGVKLNINPLIGNGTRKFPGNNDTDILITQTEYQE